MVTMTLSLINFDVDNNNHPLKDSTPLRKLVEAWGLHSWACKDARVHLVSQYFPLFH